MTTMDVMMTDAEATAVVAWLRGHDEDVIQDVCLAILEGKIRLHQLRQVARYLRRAARWSNRRRHEAHRRAREQAAATGWPRVQAPEQLRLVLAWETYARVEREAPELLDLLPRRGTLGYRRRVSRLRRARRRVNPAGLLMTLEE